MLHRICASSAVRSFVTTNGKRTFHGSSTLSIKAGDAFPEVELMEDSPGNKLSLANLLRNQDKALVVGVPAAFSPACSATHIPGYLSAKSGIPTYVVAVNDPFVMKAWKQSLVGDAMSLEGFRFLADSGGQLAAALDMHFDSEGIFGTKRSKRYALYVEKGTVKKVFSEPDNTGVNETAAGKVLSAI